MYGKEFAAYLMRTYSTLVTLVTVTVWITGSCFQPDMRFGFEAFASPLLYAGCGMLVSVVMYSKRTLTVKEVLIRKGIQFILLEVIIIFVGYGGIPVQTEEKIFVATLAVSVFVIFVLVHLIIWMQDWLMAKKMTEDLLEFQKNVKEQETEM